MKRLFIAIAILTLLALPAVNPANTRAAELCGHTSVGARCSCDDPGCICDPGETCKY